MKQYTVYFKEPVDCKYEGQQWNEETQKYELVEYTKKVTYLEFSRVSDAKKCMKKYGDMVSDTSIVKIYSNGDWEPCGKITLKGSNAIQMSNQKTHTY